MKSRIALTAILVLGVMMSGTGATIAITGASDNGSAASAEYGDSGSGNLAGQEQGGEAQPPEQVAAQGGSGSLPFTGFLAIPLLVGGVALLGTGAALRRRTRE